MTDRATREEAEPIEDDWNAPLRDENGNPITPETHPERFQADKFVDGAPPITIAEDREYGDAWRAAHDENGKLKPGHTWDETRRPNR